MITLDTKDVKGLERELKTFKERAYPFATKATVNTAAFNTRTRYQKNIKDDLVNRNVFTARSVRVEQTRTLNVNAQEAVVGSIAPYMDKQEFGGKKDDSTAIPTGYSAGQAGAKPRTRLPRKANRLASIQLKKRRGKKGTRKQQNLIAVKQAAASSNKFVHLDLGKRQGIFRVLGGKRNTRVKMVHATGQRSIRISATPLLDPAVVATEQELPEIYRKALIFQLKRHKLFR